MLQNKFALIHFFIYCHLNSNQVKFYPTVIKYLVNELCYEIINFSNMLLSIYSTSVATYNTLSLEICACFPLRILAYASFINVSKVSTSIVYYLLLGIE